MPLVRADILKGKTPEYNWGFAGKKREDSLN